MSLTIDEAIARFEANAEQNERWASGGLNPEANVECAAEHRQLAAWLRELKERRKAPEIIFCKDCAKHNKSYGDNGAIDSCPLVLYRGKAQGHEFDYQYCAFAERRTE